MTNEDSDGIHYGKNVINFFGYWTAFLFTIIIVWVMFAITLQMLHPPTEPANNFLSEFVQLIGYVVSALVGSITTLLAVFGGNKVKDMMKASADQRAQDQKTVAANRESVSKTHVAEVESYDKLEKSVEPEN